MILIVVLILVLAGLMITAIVLLVKLLRMFKMVRSELMPTEGRFAFWAAAIYTISPVDLLPDPIYLDDVGVLIAAAMYIGRLAKKHGIGPDGQPVLNRDAPWLRGQPTRPALQRRP